MTPGFRWVCSGEDEVVVLPPVLHPVFDRQRCLLVVVDLRIDIIEDSASNVIEKETGVRDTGCLLARIGHGWPVEPSLLDGIQRLGLQRDGE